MEPVPRPYDESCDGGMGVSPVHRLLRIVILSEAKDLLCFEAAKNRSFASLRMTKWGGNDDNV